MYNPEVSDETNKSIEELVDVLSKQTIVISGYSNNNNFTIKPDQEKGIITISFTDLNCNIKITLQLQNIQRSITYNYIFHTVANNFSKTIDTSYYPEGTYHLKIKISDKSFLQKLIIQ